ETPLRILQLLFGILTIIAATDQLHDLIRDGDGPDEPLNDFHPGLRLGESELGPTTGTDPTMLDPFGERLDDPDGPDLTVYQGIRVDCEGLLDTGLAAVVEQSLHDVVDIVVRHVDDDPDTGDRR